MEFDDIILWLSNLGTLAFAISGFTTAVHKKLDFFGAFVIAFVTAFGGGTLRDMLLSTQVAWVSDPINLYLVFAGSLLAYLLKNKFGRLRKMLFLFDTIGISLFTIHGLQVAQQHHLNGLYLIIFGVITATFGGAIRDILCDEIPLIFRKEIYATACIIGAAAYLGLEALGLNLILKTVLSCTIIVTVRTIAVVKNYSIPVLNKEV
ncbi:MAG: hypothetical protein RLZZ248_1424 [Bacteroidota bacterium]